MYGNFFDLNNTGTTAGRKVMNITTESIKNLGGAISADALNTVAKLDINNTGGTIEALSAATLSAGRDFNVTTTTQDGIGVECADLTNYFGKVGPASAWKPGADVRTNPPPPGTPVATSNFEGSYGPPGLRGGTSSVSHTGLYLGQDAQGIYLLHQWRNQPPTISKVKWESWNGNTYEAGGQYKVISK